MGTSSPSMFSNMGLLNYVFDKYFIESEIILKCSYSNGSKRQCIIDCTRSKDNGRCGIYTIVLSSCVDWNNMRCVHADTLTLKSVFESKKGV